LAQVKPRFEPGLFLLQRPLAQASVIVGHFGIDRANPDRNAIEVMNLILGGNGLTGRLAERIRTKEGLTYSVASSFPTTSGEISLFQITLQTRTENVVPAVTAIQEETRRLQTSPVSMEELTTAKGTLINTFVSRFPSRSKTVMTLLESEIAGNPPEYFDTLLNQYEAIRIQDVQRVAQRYLHPEGATILIVGNTPPVEAAMKTYAPVHRLALPQAE
jgi:zinc protease